MKSTTIPTTPEQALAQWSDQLSGTMQDWWDSTTKAWEPMWRVWAEPMATALGTVNPSRRRAMRRCGCGGGRADRADRCCDPCACCVPEADVVLHTRSGERRVVPFDVANGRHRDREVKLSVGDWVRCDGPDVAVRAALLPDGELTLAPCAHQVVRVLVDVGGAASGNEKPRRGDSPAERVPDLEACASGYVEVRFDGCARPVRVAVVVHPAGCDAVPVDCDCDCGCGC